MAGGRRRARGAREDANPEGYPNALRLILAEPAREAGEVVLLSTDLDDLSPEYLDPLREALLAAGALDVQLWATQMKKGRTGFRVEASWPPAEADAVGRRPLPAQHHRRHPAPAARASDPGAAGAASSTRPTACAVRVKVLDAPDGPG